MLPGQSQGWVNILWYNILTPTPTPQPTPHQKVKGDVTPWKCIFQVIVMKGTISHYFQRSFMIASSNPGAGQYIMV